MPPAPRAPAAPRVVIVEGGPGTSKSVVAVHLLAAPLAKKIFATYVSKNAAPRHVFLEQLGRLKQDQVRLASLFTGPDRFLQTHTNVYGTLIVDEAHRLTEKVGFFGDRGEHSVKDIIRSAPCTIFFLDERQQVTWKDIGSKAVISRCSAEGGAQVEILQLASEFRCAGSDGYLARIDSLLEVDTTANEILTGIPFDFRVFDDVSDMHAEIEAKNTRYTDRVVAGDCWPWKSKRDPSAFDILIGDYTRRWNLTADGSLWIVAPESFHEVDCIHTRQGLEVEYIGVIIGPDLVIKEGCLQTIPQARDRFDKSIMGYKKEQAIDPKGAAEKIDRIIKNTYRALMTRGMKGCYVYATDPSMREYLRRRSGCL